jgi:hypothetical protein
VEFVVGPSAGFEGFLLCDDAGDGGGDFVFGFGNVGVKDDSIVCCVEWDDGRFSKVGCEERPNLGYCFVVVEAWVT